MTVSRTVSSPPVPTRATPATAVFGGLLTAPAGLLAGVHTSLLAAGAVLAATTVASLTLRIHTTKEGS